MDIVEAIKSLFAKAGARHSQSDNAMLQSIHDSAVGLGASCGMKVIKEMDGSYRAIGWVSNKFRDRDYGKHPKGEIITESAHKEFIDYLNANPSSAPELWSWHTPGTARKARADWWDYSDGFLLMSWPLTEGEAKAMEGDTETVGMSHGFRALQRDHANGLILKYRTFEASDLPLRVAANPFTSIEVIRKDNTAMLSKEKRDYLVKRIGEEAVAKLEADTGAMSKALQDAGVEYKEFTETQKEDTPAPQLDEKALAQFVESIKAALNVDGLQAVIGELQQSNKQLTDSLTAINKDIAELKKSQDEKLAEAIKPRNTPINWGYRASAASDNVAKEGDKDTQANKQALDWASEVFGNLGRS